MKQHVAQPDPNALVNQTEAATILVVSRYTVYRMVDDGRLAPAGYVGGRPVFYRAAVEQLASERQQQAVA